jgi:transcriptional regulator with PAS, ATPase and Fis domain
MVNSTTCVSGDGMADAISEDFTTEGSSLEGTSFRARVRQAVREAESRIILETLSRHQWNRRRTAAALNISYRSLMYKMKYCKLRKTDSTGNPEVAG